MRYVLSADPSARLITCATCGKQVPLGEAHSVAVVYVGHDARGRVRYSVCDEDQPFACSQSCAFAAAHAYHLANHQAKRAAWEAQEPDHPPLALRLPEETACHNCNAPRDQTHVEVLVDYRLTGSARLAPWHCPHVACPDCLDGIVQTCAAEHLANQFAATHSAKYLPEETPDADDQRPTL